MVDKGFVSPAQKQAEELSLEKARWSMKQAETKRELLRKPGKDE